MTVRASAACGETGRAVGAFMRASPESAPTRAIPDAVALIVVALGAARRAPTPGTTTYPMTRRTPMAAEAATTTAPMAALMTMSTASTRTPATRAPSRSWATNTCSFHVRASAARARAHTIRDCMRRSSLISMRRPNMRASSCPDMSPFLREMMTPMEKKVARTTAVAASFSRLERLAATRAQVAATAARAAPGIIMRVPHHTAAATIPGKTEWTMASALNSRRRRLTMVETGPTTRARTTTSTNGRNA